MHLFHNCSSIIKVQKKIIRMLVSAHTETIFKLLNVLTFRQLYIYSTLCIDTTVVFYLPFLTVCLNLIKMVTVTSIRQSTQIHIFMATLEICLRSIELLEFTGYSIMRYSCILKQFILRNGVNIITCLTVTISFLHLQAIFVFITKIYEYIYVYIYILKYIILKYIIGSIDHNREQNIKQYTMLFPCCYLYVIR